MFSSFSLKTEAREALIDITDKIQRLVSEARVGNGMCVVYVPHTTAGITVNEHADPSVRVDILKGLNHLDFEGVRFSHSEGNSPAHIKSSLIGCSCTLIIESGKLKLGTWQGIFFCEFDGPRTRQVYISILG